MLNAILVLMSLFITILGLSTCYMWFDRVVVWLIRWFEIPVCRAAVMIAVSIIQQPQDWKWSTRLLTHKDIGSIYTARSAKELYLETGAGEWKPNYFERRIIWDAVKWRRSEYIRSSVNTAMMKHLQTGVINDV